MIDAEIRQFATDIAVIKNELKNLNTNITDYRENNKDIIIRLNGVEKQSDKNEERTSNIAVFQATFSIVVGAIAAYLGVKK